MTCFRAAHHILDSSARPLVMGVLNVTPDSFSDGGDHFDVEAAVARGLRIESEGGDLIDVGGESTRPGAEPVLEEEEARRVVPVVRELARRVAIPISIDTRRPEVARLALEAGAVIVNDVSAGLGFEGDRPDASSEPSDEPMARLVARTGAGLILMHMRGDPRTMQTAPHYDDVVGEVAAHLRARMAACVASGVEPERIALDPGIGFGKTMAHNLELLRRLEELTAMERPMLLGVSRKSFLRAILGLKGSRDPEERRALLDGTLAAVTACVLRGAAIVRVHDVAAARRAVEVAAALRAPSKAPARETRAT